MANKPKLLIIEGCDATGKTTLCNSLLSGFNYQKMVAIHNSKFESREEAFGVYVSQLQAFKAVQTVILDRFHISELIYGKVIRNEDNDAWALTVKEFEKEISEFYDPIVIHCHTSLNNVINEWGKRVEEEYLKKEEQLKNLYFEYNDIEKYTDLPVIKFDYKLLAESYLRIIKAIL